MIRFRTLFATASAAALAVAGCAAHAQSPAVAPSDPSPASVSEVVVTGSRIARRDYVSNSPILSIGQAAIQNTGQITVEKALTELPQFSGAFGQANAGSTSTSLNGGQAYGSLRGLGPKRTLILLDGRRLTPSNPDGSIDLNTIPDALIETVEVITGGASAVYGSDATAGVVNFKLKPRFSGVQMDVQYGQAGAGDGRQYRANATLAGDFADGRGDAVVSLDYSDREATQNRNYDFFNRRFNQIGLATIPQGNTIFGANQPTTAAVNAVFVKYGVAPLTGTSAGRYSGNIGFNTDQTLFSDIGVPVLNFRDPQTDDAYILGTQVNFGFLVGTLTAPLERYSVFGKVRYDVTPHVKIFAEVNYVNYTSSGTINPTLASNVYGLSIPVTNPYITTDFASILASRPSPNDPFTFYKTLSILGPRIQDYRYNVYQITGGLSGDVPGKDWTWDMTASYGASDFANRQTGGASASATARLLNSPMGGAEFCAGGFNPFGNITPSASCITYIARTTLNQTLLDQETIEANMQGRLFHLPAGEVRFAAGADYRRNSFSFTPDRQLSLPDGTSDILGFSVLRATGGAVDTGEVYGELLVPILKNLPLVQEFNVDFAYRYSDYNTVGGVSTYKVDFDWEVIRAVRLRGGYNRAARAPSPGELYAPVSTGSVAIGAATATTTAGDPCDTRSSFRRGAAAAQVRALCLAQGVPAAIIDTYQLSTAQVFALSGGNPSLRQEEADTYSIGGVFQPRFASPLFRKLSFSVDYYKIKINQAIGTLSIATAIPFCFNSAGNNPSYSNTNFYCSLLTRNASNGAFVNPTQPLLNLATFEVGGVDMQLDWSFGLGAVGLRDAWGRVGLNMVVSHLDSFKLQSLPGAATYDYVGTIGQSIDTVGGATHPDWKAVTSLSYAYGPVSIGLVWRYIDAMKSSTRATSATNTTHGVNSYNALDLNARWDLDPRLQLRVGLTNLTDRDPPQVGDAAPTTDVQDYDFLGRTFFAGLRAKF